MDEFLEKVRAYADALGVSPTTVVQRAKCGGGGTWSKWESGTGSPTMLNADKLLKYMAENPVPKSDAEPLKGVG
tara:strand:- start:2513 stop:2734 length:222 start_codon:yes stop_codon:yes gene_type:complete